MTQPQDELQVLTQAEVSELVKLSRTAIYRQCKTGTFPPKIQLDAKRIGFLRRDVRDWIEARQAGKCWQDVVRARSEALKATPQLQATLIAHLAKLCNVSSADAEKWAALERIARWALEQSEIEAKYETAPALLEDWERYPPEIERERWPEVFGEDWGR